MSPVAIPLFSGNTFAEVQAANCVSKREPELSETSDTSVRNHQTLCFGILAGSDRWSKVTRGRIDAPGKTEHRKNAMATPSQYILPVFCSENPVLPIDSDYFAIMAVTFLLSGS